MLQNYLLSSSLDGSIKVWSPGSSGNEIINSLPEFRYPEEETEGRGYRQVSHQLLGTESGQVLARIAMLSALGALGTMMWSAKSALLY